MALGNCLEPLASFKFNNNDYVMSASIESRPVSMIPDLDNNETIGEYIMLLLIQCPSIEILSVIHLASQHAWIHQLCLPRRLTSL